MTDEENPANGTDAGIQPQEQEQDQEQEQEQRPENPPSKDQLPENHDTAYGVVDWDGPDDPENPMNWSITRKWITISIVSFTTLNM
jgi:hypothetical protein